MDWWTFFYIDANHHLRELDPEKYQHAKKKPMLDAIRGAAERYFSARGTIVDPDTICNLLEEKWSKDDWYYLRQSEPIEFPAKFVIIQAKNFFIDYERRLLVKRCDPPRWVSRCGPVYVDLHKRFCCHKMKVNEIVDLYMKNYEKLMTFDADTYRMWKFLDLLPSSPEEKSEVIRASANKFSILIANCLLDRPVSEPEETVVDGEVVSKFDSILSHGNKVEEELEREQSLEVIAELSGLLGIAEDDHGYEVTFADADTLRTLKSLLQEFSEQEIVFMNLRFVQSKPRRDIEELFDMKASAVVKYEEDILERLRDGFRRGGFEIPIARRKDKGSNTSGGKRERERDAATYLKSILPNGRVDDE